MIGCIPPSIAARALRAECPVVGAASLPRPAYDRAENRGRDAAPTGPQPGLYTPDQSRVMTILVVEAGRSISARELSARTEIPDRRMRLTIRELVMRGEPIVSMAGPGGGFRFADSAAELQADRARKRREALSLLYRLSRQDRTMVMAELAGQERLDLNAECDERTANVRERVSPEAPHA